MKRIISCLSGFTAIASFGYAPMVDNFNSLSKWLIPAYLYIFLFGVIIFLGLIVISFLHKERINQFYKQLNNYLRTNPFTSIDLGGGLLAIPLGLISGVLFRIYWFSAVGLVLPLMILFIIVLSFGTIRNKILNNHTLKLLSFLSIAALTSSLLFIIGSSLGLPQLEQEHFEWGRHINRLYNHPFDSLIYIWEFVPFFIFLVPLADILVLIGKFSLKLRLLALPQAGQI